MIAIACIINAVLGALWRRAFGMENDIARWLHAVTALPLTWPLWFAFEPFTAAVLSAAAILFFFPGHKVDSPTVWLRYGPFAWGFAWVMPAWPRDWTWGRFIDGGMAVGELILGASFWGTLTLVMLL